MESHNLALETPNVEQNHDFSPFLSTYWTPNTANFTMHPQDQKCLIRMTSLFWVQKIKTVPGKSLASASDPPFADLQIGQ